jgi:uncharacterized protein
MTWKSLAILLAALASAAGCLCAGTGPAQAQPAAGTVAASRALVIETPEMDSTETQVINEMARLVNSGNTVRVIPLVGQGSVQAIGDLLSMQSVNAAIVQSDVLANFKRTQRIPGIQSKLQYVTKLYSQEVHILARMQFTCLSDLNGRRVNFGAPGSGAGVTAQTLFEAFNIRPQPVFLEQSEAFEKLRNGEIDAVVYVGGKPSAAFQRLRYIDRVHFLDVDFADTLRQDYVPGLLTHDDYPDLIAPDERVSTISVASVLVLSDRRTQSQQYRNMSALVERLFRNVRRMKSKRYHPKWQEVNIAAPLQDWQRFNGAKAWLANNAASITKAEQLEKALRNPKPDPNASPESAAAAEKVRAALRQFMETQGQNGLQDKEELFNQFVRWYEIHKEQ